MDDAFSYCVELVRKFDRDRYLATLFAPAPHRNALFALFAFNVETGRVRSMAREPLPGEIRLQWWREVLEGERAGEASANPVAAALLRTIKQYGFAAGELTDLVEARRFDVYDEPMTSIADVELYVRRTASAVIGVATQILGVEADAAAEPAGMAYGIADLLRAFRFHATRRQLYVPIELLERHGVSPHQVFAGQSSTGLNAALAELRGLTRRHLAAARDPVLALPADAQPAFLPVALVRPMLDRLDRSDAFVATDLPAWRRQWLIWRAARNPARITD